MNKLLRWWLAMEPVERQRASMLFWVGIVYLIHYLVFCIPQPFFIEDAGISFAYARNFVDGEGFVSYPGGERVEGFSNPLWTFVIAFFYALGVSVWASSKILGAVFGLLTLPFVFDITKRTGLSDKWAMLAPLCLALSPNFVIWNASGLENSLYCFLLAMGMWRLLLEGEDHRRHPWSGFVFCLVAMTRPEGMMYALVAGFARLIFAIVERRYLSFLGWIAVFGIPFGLYQAWRYWYFSWPYPNTYYAKLGTGKRFKPFGWTVRGWKYINAYLGDHNIVDMKIATQEIKIHMGYVLPLLLVAMGGLKKRLQAALTILCILWLCVVILWDGKWVDGPDIWRDIQPLWIKIRVFSILGMAGLVGLISLFRQGWRARSLLWAMGCSSVFFVIYAGGDWMKAHRWFNIVELFMIPVLVIGLYGFTQLIPNHWKLPSIKRFSGPKIRTVIVTCALLCYAVSEIKVSSIFVVKPETSVSDIHRRVRYMQWVQNRLDVDHVTLLDVDMGAHMYYSGWNIVDTAGLVDVSIARHSDYPRKFIKEYIFKERLPEFAHCHGGWARTSRITKDPAWKKRYIEIPGYPIGNRRVHIGNHIRKDLFTTTVDQEDLKQGKLFLGGVRLLSWEVPSPQVAAGGALFIKTVWQNVQARKEDVQVLIGLRKEGKIVNIASFQPGYRWYDMKDWDKFEAVEGKFPIPIPQGTPEGEYELWMTILDGKSGNNLAPMYDAKEANGLQWLDLGEPVEVVSMEVARQQAEMGHQRSLQLAVEDQCEESWGVWKDATKHLYRNKAWKKRYDTEHRSAVAECYFARAKENQDESTQIELLLETRKWDHRIDGLEEYLSPIAADFDQRGQDLFSFEDWDGAYQAFSTSVALDPSRSMTRRRAEEARDKRLKLTPPYKKKQKKKSKTTKPFKKQILK